VSNDGKRPHHPLKGVAVNSPDALILFLNHEVKGCVKSIFNDSVIPNMSHIGIAFITPISIVGVKPPPFRMISEPNLETLLLLNLL
jgi:hypothetical protein